MSTDPKVETTAEKLRRANIANIIKKLSAGKTLSAVEQATIDEHEAAEAEAADKSKPEKINVRYWAKFWRVSKVTIRNMMEKCVAGGMPAVNNIPAILKWEPDQKKKSPEFAKRCAELRAELGEPGADAKPKEDVDWIRFRESGGAPKDHGAQIKTLEMFRDGYAMKLDAAMRQSDQPGVRHWNALLIETTNAIRQNKLAADKLGLDEGEIISFDEMERIIFALGYWLMRSVDHQLDALASRLAALPPGASSKEYRAVCEAQLISSAWVTPWAKASKPSGVSLPARAVNKMRTVCGDFIERGEDIWREETARRAQP